MDMSTWYLYIIRCSDNSLYTGITIDVDRRLEEHCGKGKNGAKYLKGRGPLKLEFQAKIGDRGLAMIAEIKVKQLPKRRKEMLIRGEMDIEELID